MAITNTKITLHGEPVEVVGSSLKVGDPLPNFILSGSDLKDIKSEEFNTKILVLSVVPSVDTPTCQVQTRKFNEKVNSLGQAMTVLCVSRDLPFALNRFCGAEGLSNIKVGSDYKYRTFGKAYGVDMEGAGLLARAVFIADTSGKIVHVEYVSEVSAEPNYDEAFSVIGSLL